MLRRRTHLRSTNGCLTCKERHVRCDERRPYCRNCVRLGRECKFPVKAQKFTILTSGHAVSIKPQVQEIPTNWAKGYTVYYGAPHHRDISSTALAILQQSQSFSNARPMPSSFWLKITKDYAPNYHRLGGYYDCVKYAIISFGAYNHWQGSKSPVAQEVCITHYTSALRELQKEIDNFSSFNADAITCSSVFLAGTAQDWDAWSVFVDGYSKALSQIMSSNYKTLFPELLTERFQLRRYFSTVDTSLNGLEILLCERSLNYMKFEVALVIDAIINASSIVGNTRWRSMGFEDLETLSRVIEESLSLTESERYHKLSWLRTWMFWLDLRELMYGIEENALSALFYALLLAIISIFPRRYRLSLRSVCMERIQTNLKDLLSDVTWEKEAAFLSKVIKQELELQEIAQAQAQESL